MTSEYHTLTISYTKSSYGDQNCAQLYGTVYQPVVYPVDELFVSIYFSDGTVLQCRRITQVYWPPTAYTECRRYIHIFY